MARQLVVAGERGHLDARDELGGGRLADARHREQAPIGLVARDLGGDQVRQRLGVGLEGADPPGEHREHPGLRADLFVGGPGGLREALPQRAGPLGGRAPRGLGEPLPAGVQRLPGPADLLQDVELPGLRQVDEALEGGVRLDEGGAHAVLAPRGLLHREGELGAQAPGALQAVGLVGHGQQGLGHAGGRGGDRLGVLGVVLRDPREELPGLLLALARDVGDVAAGGERPPHHHRADVAALVDHDQAPGGRAAGRLEGPLEEGVDAGPGVLDAHGEHPGAARAPGEGDVEALSDVEAHREAVLRVVLARLEAGLRGPEHGGILPSVSANAPAPGRPPGNTHITSRGWPWKTRPACSYRSSSADMPPAPATPPGPSEEAGHKGRARAAGRVAQRAAQTYTSSSRNE